MKLDKPITRPAINEVIQKQILFEFNPEDHEPTGIKTVLVVGWSEDGKIRVDKKVDLTVVKDDLCQVLTKKQMEALRDIQRAVLVYGLEKGVGAGSAMPEKE